MIDHDRPTTHTARTAIVARSDLVTAHLQRVLPVPGIMFDYLVTYAGQFFVECPDDFCVQHAEPDVIVFGGTNRLIWSMRRGFRCDPTYCTQRFLDHAAPLL